MKRIAFLTGVTLLLLPRITAAQCTTELSSLTPVGRYAQLVVNRIDEAIAAAKAEKGDSPAISVFDFHFLETISSALYMLVDTDLRSVEYSRDLGQVNACLHIDLAILEAKMEEIRCEANEAYARGSTGGIRKLKELAAFTNERYRILVQGAVDPTYEDEAWQYYYPFDEDAFRGWCCNTEEYECRQSSAADCGLSGGFYPTADICLSRSVCATQTESDSEPRYSVECPFDSDYLEPDTDGFGCDPSVLDRLGSESVDDEKSGLEAIENARNTFLKDSTAIRDLTARLHNYAGKSTLTDREVGQLSAFGNTKTDDIPHRRFAGCFAEFPDVVREASEDRISTPLRGVFTLGKDHMGIHIAFFALMEKWAREREFPRYLKNPDEFYREDERRTAKEDAGETDILRAPRDYLRTIWTNISRRQATEEAAVLPKAQDAALQIRDALAPIRPAMKKNIALVTGADTGLRKFAKNYAYFLRRSCIYRPCNERLDTIIKLLLTDECFPYASGLFAVQKNEEAPDGESSWVKCKKAMEAL